jgi:hypothetical protein
MACTDYISSPFGMFDADYQRKVPLAAAITSCATDDDENLTFEVFADAKQAREFLDAKQAMLCTKMAAHRLFEFPGFPYVDGGAWIVEPDEKATADKLAPILGGTAQQRPCRWENSTPSKTPQAGSRLDNGLTGPASRSVDGVIAAPFSFPCCAVSGEAVGTQRPAISANIWKIFWNGAWIS